MGEPERAVLPGLTAAELTILAEAIGMSVLTFSEVTGLVGPETAVDERVEVLCRLRAAVLATRNTLA